MSKAFQKEVLKLLRTNGSDVTKPHNFEFFLYVATKVNATKAAAKIRRGGFSMGKISRDAPGRRWLCVAKRTIVPNQVDMSDYSRFFEKVAAALDGEFDGWDAEIVEKK